MNVDVRKVKNLQKEIRSLEDNIRSSLIDLNSFLVENIAALKLSVDDFEVGVDARGAYIKNPIYSCTYILSSPIDEVLDVVYRLNWEKVIDQLEFLLELQLESRRNAFNELNALVYALTCTC